MDISLAIAQGLHNAPRLYGDATVRRPVRITGLHSGLRAAGKEFVYGIYDGVTGLVAHPYHGAREHGAMGLVKGIGKGVGGFVLKDLAAAVGPVGYTLKGLHKELQKRKGPVQFIRQARIAQGRQEREQLSPEEEKDTLELLGQGWAVFLEMRKFVKHKKTQGLGGRLRVKQEEKRWRKYGAFENVAKAKEAFEATKAAERAQGALPETQSVPADLRNGTISRSNGVTKHTTPESNEVGQPGLKPTG